MSPTTEQLIDDVDQQPIVKAEKLLAPAWEIFRGCVPVEFAATGAAKAAFAAAFAEALRVDFSSTDNWTAIFKAALPPQLSAAGITVPLL